MEPEMQEKSKSRRPVFTLVLIFSMLIGYVFLNSFMRTGGCGGIGAGTPVPQITLPMMQGGDVSMSDYKGKVLIINFWLTTCPPCRKEMPSLMSLHKKYKDADNFALLTISCDEQGEKVVKELFEKRNWELPVAFDPERKAADMFSVTGFPETFFVDKNGVIRHKFISSRNWLDKKFTSLIDVMLAE